MAEVTAGGHRGGWPPDRDVLLATKLHVPHSRPGLVTRPRLADLLDEGADRGLVLVAAPAGYGKSVLLSQSGPEADPARRLAVSRRGGQ